MVSGNLRKQFIALAWKRVRPGSGSHREFLEARTWKHPVTNLKQFVQQTAFVVVGGIATRLYMPERTTLDLDILVLAEDAPLLYRELQQANSQQLGILSIGKTTWQLPDRAMLDVIESGEPWVEAAIEKPVWSPDGLPIIALPYLVIMKLQVSLVQDLADISRMLGGADEETLAGVRTVISSYLADAVEDLESLIELGKLEYEKQ